MRRTLSGAGLFAFVAAIAYAISSPALAPAAHILQDPLPVRVLFAGDLMLDRNVARSAEASGVESLFGTSTRAIFDDADLRVVNLEGTITTQPSIARQDSSILRFTFKPQTAKAVLELLRVDVASQANNHALDFGADGYDSTQRYLAEWGISSFGHPTNAENLSATVDVKGKTLCFAGYHALFSPSVDPIVERIEALKAEGSCWRIVVFAHWGEEYKTKANTAQMGQGRAFIDAGADVVIGAHPHVVEEVETYKGKAIFYSLGNFMFDQNFSWATMHGLAVRADFYEDKTAFTLIPMTIAQQHSEVAGEPQKSLILKAAGGVAEFTLP